MPYYDFLWDDELIRHIEQHGVRCLVDLKTGHFRQLVSPYEALEFGSERGRELAAAAGVRTCHRCATSFIAAATSVDMRCVKCAEPINPVLSQPSVVEIAHEDGQDRTILEAKA